MNAIPLILTADGDGLGGALVLADGWIGDRRYRFLLDTGAATTSVISDPYGQTFPVQGCRPSGGVFESYIDELVAIPPLIVGPICKAGLVVARNPASLLYPTLGMDVLQAYRLEFRFAEGLVVVGDDERAPRGYPLTTSAGGHPLIEVALGDATALSVRDTGSSITVVDPRLIASRPSHFSRIGSSSGTDSGGATESHPMCVMSGAEIGGIPLAAHVVAVVDLANLGGTTSGIQAILGYTSLVQTDWLFDFPSLRWAVYQR